MTNFEKWKDNLKPENLIFHSSCYGIQDASIFIHGEKECCEYCPARNKCKIGRSKECKESWLEWANAPANENE